MSAGAASVSGLESLGDMGVKLASSVTVVIASPGTRPAVTVTGLCMLVATMTIGTWVLIAMTSGSAGSVVSS